MTRIHLSFVVALCAVASGAWHDAPSRPASVIAPPRGTLLIVGGGPQPPALVAQFVELAGGSGHATIAIFAEASADGLKSGEEKAVELRALGANARNIWVTREEANTDSIAKLLNSVT